MAGAMFLKQPVTYVVVQPIGNQTYGFRFVENLDSILDFFANG